MRGQQCLIESLDEQVGVIGPEHQRRPDLENIGMGPGGADQHAPLAQHVDNPRSFIRGRRSGFAAAPELHADEQASAAYFRDQIVQGL
jgi:hypothetical protein